jgi:hypothetical protein
MGDLQYVMHSSQMCRFDQRSIYYQQGQPTTMPMNSVRVHLHWKDQPNH